MADGSTALQPFQMSSAPIILSWIESAEELWNWTARKDFPLQNVDVFSEWHADPDVTPWEYIVEGELIGYGELWCKPDEPWAELGRIVIAPSRRGGGHGRSLVRALIDRVQQRGFPEAWVRVRAENHVALASYSKAGFVRVSVDCEAELNANQPTPYVWLRHNFVNPVT